jgi:Fic family protein
MYLLDFLQIKGEDFETRVLQGGTDEEIRAWVKAQARPLTDEDIRQWNERILNGGPKDEAARQRFQARRAEIAAKRGVSVEQLPRAATWVDIIELDEERM